MQFVYGKSKVKAAGLPVSESGDLAFVSAKAGRNQDEQDAQDTQRILLKLLCSGGKMKGNAEPDESPCCINPLLTTSFHISPPRANCYAN